MQAHRLMRGAWLPFSLERGEEVELELVQYMEEDEMRHRVATTSQRARAKAALVACASSMSPSAVSTSRRLAFASPLNP